MPLTSKVLSSSQSVTVPSGDSVITGAGTGQSIVTVTSFDSADSSPPITALATRVYVPSPRSLGLTEIVQVEGPSSGVMSEVLPISVSVSPSFT